MQRDSCTAVRKTSSSQASHRTCQRSTSVSDVSRFALRGKKIYSTEPIKLVLFKSRCAPYPARSVTQRYGCTAAWHVVITAIFLACLCIGLRIVILPGKEEKGQRKSLCSHYRQGTRRASGSPSIKRLFPVTAGQECKEQGLSGTKRVSLSQERNI